MPLPDGCGVGSGLGVCAWTQTANASRNRTARGSAEYIFKRKQAVEIIALNTFQQGTFGPAEIVNTSVAAETPATKNCGVIVKIASKT